MYAEPLVLDNGTADQTFSIIERLNPNGTKRLNLATTISEPETLIIRHHTTGPKTNLVDRHNAVLTRVERDVVSSLYNAAYISVSAVVPRTGQFSLVEITKLWAMAKELFDTDSGLERFLRNES